MTPSTLLHLTTYLYSRLYNYKKGTISVFKALHPLLADVYINIQIADVMTVTRNKPASVSF